MNWRTSLIGLLLALIVAGFVILAAGYSPLQAYGALLRGSFGSVGGVAQALQRSMPLIFTGLSVAAAMRCGLINIGAEGQLLMGAVAAAYVGFAFSLPGGLHLIAALVAAAAAGGLWAALAGFLKVVRGAHEVIITIMLNYVAVHLTSYLVNYPLKVEGPVAQTPMVEATARLARFGGTELSWAFPLAVIAALVTAYYLFRTQSGYELRAVGRGIQSARTAGIPVEKTLVLSMAISGALAGLGGAGAVLGTHYRFIQGFSPGYGYDGIAVAVLGGSHPLGVLASSFLFGVLRAGGMTMDRTTPVPIDFIVVIQALVILFVATPKLISLVRQKGGVPRG